MGEIVHDDCSWALGSYLALVYFPSVSKSSRICWKKSRQIAVITNPSSLGRTPMVGVT